MTELQIYKFIHENNLECRWQTFWENKKEIDKLNVWIPSYLLKEFCDMLGYSAFDDGGISEVKLCFDGSIFVNNLDEILDYYGIEAENILEKPKDE